MTLYIVRDGRPFQATPDAQAVSLPFPLPSTTVTGLMRTLLGTGSAGFDATRLKEILSISMHGPLLVQLSEADEIAAWYAPAPADCLIMNDDKQPKQVCCYQAIPTAAPIGAIISLEALLPVMTRELVEGKRKQKCSRILEVGSLRALAHQPWQNCRLPPPGQSYSVHALPNETRTHVAIEPNTLASKESALFTTNGLVFTQIASNKQTLIRMALAVECPTADALSGFASLGGERRLSRIRASAVSLPPCPEPVVESIVATRHCRLDFTLTGLVRARALSGLVTSASLRCDTAIDQYDE